MDLVLSCYLNVGGLSRAAQEFFKCLGGMGFRTVVMSVGLPSTELMDPALASEMSAAMSRQAAPGFIQLHVGIPESIFYAHDRRALLASTVVEGNFLTREQASACLSADAILVPSRFCHDVMASSGFPRGKLFLVPYPLDVSIWNPSVAPSMGPGDRFRFLYMNTWYERKGYDVLLRAWWEEFSAGDPVELVIKSYQEDTRTRPIEASLAMLALRWRVNRGRRAPIRVMDQAMGDRQVPGFMRSFDALVSPHRAEGFGMNVWYALALGVPVICTSYSGTTDFATGETSWPVKVGSMSRPGAEEVSIFPQLKDVRWAEPDVADLRRQMRACLENRAERTLRARAGVSLVTREYSQDVVMGRLREAMDKAAPGSWAMLSEGTKRLDVDPPRFSSEDEPVEMIEV